MNSTEVLLWNFRCLRIFQWKIRTLVRQQFYWAIQIYAHRLYWCTQNI